MDNHTKEVVWVCSGMGLAVAILIGMIVINTNRDEVSADKNTEQTQLCFYYGRLAEQMNIIKQEEEIKDPSFPLAVQIAKENIAGLQKDCLMPVKPGSAAPQTSGPAAPK